jgi:hypothetical protein
MNTQIKVFGQEAKEIKPGDIFTAEFDSIEGHDVVTLVKNNAIDKLLKLIDEGAIGLDQMVTYLRNLNKGVDPQ